MVTRRSLILLLVVFLMGCSPASPTPTPVPASEIPVTPEPPTASPDYVTRIRNAEYQLGFTDALRVVQLSNGRYEEGAPGDANYVSVTIADLVAAGDLDGDGRNEISVLAAENYGGSGVFMFLAVYSNVNGTLRFQTSTFVDDRPLLNALAIENGEIFLDATTHGSEDPFCCPTVHTVRHYRLAMGGQLTMVNYTTFTPDGRPRTITINAPAPGTEVSGSLQIRGRVDIAPFENNLVYRIYSLGNVELGLGSITVNAEELGGPGSFDSVISLGTILSGTVVRVEVQDINAADGSLFAMDSVELVVK